MLIAINNAYERVVSLVIKADGRWQWDDTNQTDLPISTTALVANQQDYSLATSHLEVTRVEMKDQGGIWRLLTPIDQNDIKGIALGEYQKTAGVPTQYDKLGNSIFLYPAPNFSQSASLKVYFTRGPASFTSGEVTTGTKQPGFTPLYHDLIPLWVAYNYALDNVQNTATGYLNEITRKETELLESYQKRSKDEQVFIRGVRRSSR